MHRQTKRTSIPPKVKRQVWERDGGQCVLCHRNDGHPDAHIVARSHGGLGIAENIVTLCPRCHYRYDQTAERHMIRAQLEEYITTIYPDWTEEAVTYHKY